MKWEPIEKYDAMKKKPKHVVFWMKRADQSRMPPPAGICKERYYGFRTITHFLILPEPPADEDTGLPQ